MDEFGRLLMHMGLRTKQHQLPNVVLSLDPQSIYDKASCSTLESKNATLPIHRSATSVSQTSQRVLK